MAHKKGQGSSRNGRDSQSQRLGVKAHDGNVVSGGTIIRPPAWTAVPTGPQRRPRQRRHDFCQDCWAREVRGPRRLRPRHQRAANRTVNWVIWIVAEQFVSNSSITRFPLCSSTKSTFTSRPGTADADAWHSAARSSSRAGARAEATAAAVGQSSSLPARTSTPSSISGSIPS